MLGNLQGWHVLVILGIVLLLIVAIAVIMIVAVRGGQRRRRAQTEQAGPAEQIRQLAELRDQGFLTDSEFEAKKQELLGRL